MGLTVVEAPSGPFPPLDEAAGVPRGQIDALTPIFVALADRRRREVRRLLRVSEPQSVTELVCATAVNQPNLSRHLAVLKAVGLLARQQAGRSTLNSLASEGQAKADAWFAALFEGRSDFNDSPLTDDELDRGFRILSRPWARLLLSRIAWSSEASAGSLEALMAVSQPVSSNRLRLMHEARLLSRRAVRSKRLYAMEASTLWTLWGETLNQGLVQTVSGPDKPPVS